MPEIVTLRDGDEEEELEGVTCEEKDTLEHEDKVGDGEKVIVKIEERLVVYVTLSEEGPVTEDEEVKESKGLKDVVTEIVDDEL